MAASVSINNQNGGVHHDSEMFEDEPCEITPIDDYNAEEGKFQASLKWLIVKAFEKNIPDQLQSPFSRDAHGVLHLRPPAMYSLTSGQLYSDVASKLFHDGAFLTHQSHAAVLQALRRIGLDLVDTESGQQVTETALTKTTPVRTTAHLAVIDALMTVNMRQLISIERVMEAVKKYTTVDRRESPVDIEDALLFWINKICSAVRDNMEKAQRRAGGSAADCPVIPEMEDLYEDMCDGACICTLLAFYRPNQMNVNEICLNDPMGIGDCAYNLGLLRNFCQHNFPWNPFHFQTEDILYLHECLQPNLNALLTDLFCLLEPQITETKTTAAGQAGGSRRLEHISGIPDLRGDTQRTQTAANIRAKLNPPPGQLPSVATSLMNSADSLMTQRSADSLKYRPYAKQQPHAVKKSPTTTFGELRSKPTAASDERMTVSQYHRSETMPASTSANAPASVRLALEEKRRQYETQRMHLNSQLAKDRQQMGKEAFFTLLGKTQSAADKLKNGARRGTDNSSDMQELNKNMMALQQQMKRLSTEQDRLQKMFQDDVTSGNQKAQLSPVHVENQNQTPPPQLMSHAISQPVVYPGVYASPHSFVGASPAAPMAPVVSPHHVYAAPIAASPPVSMPNAPMSAGLSTSPYYGGMDAFHLHTDTEPPSRLDPQLELNRNLTNWGMTYRAGSGRTPRRTWDTGTYARSEMDLYSAPGQVFVPPPEAFPAPTQRILQRPMSYHSTSSGSPGPSFEQTHEQIHIPQTLHDTSGSTSSGAAEPQPEARIVKAKSAEPKLEKEPPAKGFVVDVSADDNEKRVVEMEQKREQLMINAVRRREMMERKRQEAERKGAARRNEEERKQEELEKKKAEREQKRQQVFEDYQKKKLEQEQLESGTASPSSTPRSPRLNRGQSQPPRPKSQLVTHSQSVRVKADDRRQAVKSGSVDNMDQITRPIPVPSTQAPNQADLSVTPVQQRRSPRLNNRDKLSADQTIERRRSPRSNIGRPPIRYPEQDHSSFPSVKPFVKANPKSNRSIIINALQYSVFAGAVHDDNRRKVLEELAKSDSKHFLLLFRDQKCQYRGLYAWDEASDTVHKIHGVGPKAINETLMQLMYKYDSGAKQFSSIPTRHLSPTMDGFTVKDQVWQKSKVPHSGKR